MIQYFFRAFFFEPRPWLSYPTRKWEKTSFSTKMPRAGGTGHWPCRMVEVAASLGISSLKDSDSGQDPLLPCIYIYIYIYTRHPPAFWLTYRPATLRGLYASLSWGIHKLPGGAGFWAISRWYCLKSGTSTQIFASLELHGLSWQKTSIAWYSNRFGWVAPWEMWSDKLVAHRGVETAHPFNFVAPHLWGDFLEILSTLLGLYLENPGNFTAWDAKKGRCSGSWVVPCAGLHGFMACYVRPATKCATTEQNHGPKAPGCGLMLRLWRWGELWRDLNKWFVVQVVCSCVVLIFWKICWWSHISFKRSCVFHCNYSYWNHRRITPSLETMIFSSRIKIRDWNYRTCNQVSIYQPTSELFKQGLCILHGWAAG